MAFLKTSCKDHSLSLFLTLALTVGIGLLFTPSTTYALCAGGCCQANCTNDCCTGQESCTDGVTCNLCEECYCDASGNSNCVCDS